MSYEEAMLKLTAGFGIVIGLYEAIKKIVAIFKSPSKEVKDSLEEKIDKLDERIGRLESEVSKLKDDEETLNTIQKDIKMVFTIQFAQLQHAVTGNHLNDMNELLSKLGNHLNDN